MSRGDPLADADARDYAVRDYKRRLQQQRKLAASTVNLALAALDDFSRHLGLEPANVDRQQAASVAPRALDEDEQRRLLRAVERRAGPRGAAICQLALNAGTDHLQGGPPAALQATYDITGPLAAGPRR